MPADERPTGSAATTIPPGSTHDRRIRAGSTGRRWDSPLPISTSGSVHTAAMVEYMQPGSRTATPAHADHPARQRLRPSGSNEVERGSGHVGYDCTAGCDRGVTG